MNPRCTPPDLPLADELAGLAQSSLYYAAMLAAATRHEKAALAADLLVEQEKLLDRIAVAGITAFSAADSASARREWLDANIDRMDKSHPMLARYGDLHDRRHEFVPALN